MAKIHINNPKQVINGGAKKYYFKVKGLGGPKGDKGDKGDTGATGPQGPQGNAATVSIGSTITLPVGNDATVTNSGSIYNAVLNFGIPQGPRGPQGATGAKGDKGDKGDQGNPGPQGEKGTNATVTVGTTTTTEPGTQAYAWNSSSNPNNAVINFNIPRGATGATGATGPAGADGADGQDGQNFTPTIVETLPTTGDQSKLYLTPKAHTTSTATGNPIEATITAQAGQLESFQLDGDTFQQTYTGKNLWSNTPYKVGYYINPEGREVADNDTCIYGNIETSPNTTYTLTLTNLGVSANVRAHAYDENGNWIKQIGVLFIATDEKKSMTFTTPANAKYLRWSFWVKSKIADGQIEKGSTATDYEPYVGGQPSPSPEYPQPIQTVTGEQTVEIVGKNLFDKNNYDSLDAYVDGSTIKASANNKLVWIPCEPDTAYAITVVNSSVSTGVYSAPDIPVVGGTANWLGGIAAGDTTRVFTTKPAAKYIVVRIWNNTASHTVQEALDALQVEAGSTATTYAPYSKQTYTINLGSIELCKLGDYQDYIYKSGDDWKLHKWIGKYTYEGTESGWAYSTNVGVGAEVNGVFYRVKPTGADGTNYPNPSVSISDHFISGVRTPTKAGSFVIGANITFASPSATIDNATKWEGWLASNNTTVYYKYLAGSATDTVITDTNLIAQLETVKKATLANGQNTITNTATGTNLAGDMEIGYYGYNPTNRYDKFIWLDLNNNYEQIGGE